MSWIRRGALLLAIGATIGATIACNEREVEPVDVRAIAIEGHHECASCGMIIREQPSPRGQLVHRDGTRAFFCSLADLAAYHDMPSPHGRVLGAWVEALPVELDPAAHDVTEQAWIDVNAAHFVVGVAPRRVMGTPALTYESADDASRVAARSGGRALRWQEAMRALGGAH